jgi:mannose-6-phosphate isomerase
MEQEKMQSWLGRNETFVDPNHKPEVAVVLSDRFLGFVGFRSVEEIQQFVRDVAELREAIGSYWRRECEKVCRFGSSGSEEES